MYPSPFFPVLQLIRSNRNDMFNVFVYWVPLGLCRIPGTSTYQGLSMAHLFMSNNCTIAGYIRHSAPAEPWQIKGVLMALGK